MSDKELPSEFIIRKKSVRVDVNGLVCLNDIWELAGFTKNKRPPDWRRLPQTIKLMGALIEKVMGKSHGPQKVRASSIIYACATGTFAHPVLACAYAGYLSPKLEIEIREVWLRYKQGDATLADEILSKASPEANEWAGVRALSRTTRNRYTDTLSRHGVQAGTDFAICTNETYQALFDGTAKQLKKDRSVTGNLRDSMTISELSYVMASEALASERIEDQNNQGRMQCQISTRISAKNIREAIEKDRASRRKA